MMVVESEKNRDDERKNRSCFVSKTPPLTAATGFANSDAMRCDAMRCNYDYRLAGWQAALVVACCVAPLKEVGCGCGWVLARASVVAVEKGWDHGESPKPKSQDETKKKERR